MKKEGIEREERKIYNENIGRILINMKDELFDLLDDLIQNKIEIKTFTKNNRLFYIGILFVTLSIFLLGYIIIIGDYDNKEEKSKGININHNHYIKYVSD